MRYFGFWDLSAKGRAGTSVRTVVRVTRARKKGISQMAKSWWRVT